MNRINAAEIDGEEEDYYTGNSNASQFWRSIEEYRQPFKPTDYELFNPVPLPPPFHKRIQQISLRTKEFNDA